MGSGRLPAAHPACGPAILPSPCKDRTSPRVSRAPCTDISCSPASDHSILGEAHVLGELLVSVDVCGEEIGKLGNRAAADVVIERRDLIAQLGIAQGLVRELVPA